VVLRERADGGPVTDAAARTLRHAIAFADVLDERLRVSARTRGDEAERADVRVVVVEEPAHQLVVSVRQEPTRDAMERRLATADADVCSADVANLPELCEE